ncbi:hypothetical protein F5Y15DRAFT_424913 [Xylariaceae sp. FL0016]|nr:hypothetical protein F5Y15DRAFT_424913 [Xylariaceae sp. FL0016]
MATSHPRMRGLPTELVREIIFSRLRMEDLEFKYILRLRLISHKFNDETMDIVRSEQLLSRKQLAQYKKLPWENFAYARDAIDSEAAFLATYLITRPHDQQFWNANLSAFINVVLDRVFELHGESMSLPKRDSCLKILCFHSINSHVWWKPSGFASHPCLDLADTSTITSQLWLTPRVISDPSGVFLQYHVDVARILLGGASELRKMMPENGQMADTRWTPLRNQVPIGTKLYAAITTGDVDLIKTVLNSVEEMYFYRYPEACIMRWAVQTGSSDVVQLFLTKRFHWGVDFFGAYPLDLVVMEAIRLRHDHISHHLLRRKANLCKKKVCHSILREACRHGDLWVVKYCIRWGLFKRQYEWALTCCCTPLEIAATAGHADIVDLLLKKGADPSGEANAHAPPRGSLAYYWHTLCENQSASKGAMYGAAMNGHTKVAQLFLDAGDGIPQATLEPMVKVAEDRGHTEFLSWMRNWGLIEHTGGRSSGAKDVPLGTRTPSGTRTEDDKTSLTHESGDIERLSL